MYKRVGSSVVWTDSLKPETRNLEQSRWSKKGAAACRARNSTTHVAANVYQERSV